MTFHDIVNEISHLAPVRILSSTSGTDISKVKLWANHPESEKETILFFGYDTQPESWPDHYILAFDRIDSGLFSQSDPFQDERPVRLIIRSSIHQINQISQALSHLTIRTPIQ